MTVQAPGTQPATQPPVVPQDPPPAAPTVVVSSTPVEVTPVAQPSPAPVASAPAPTTEPAAPAADADGQDEHAQRTSFPSHLRFSDDQQRFISERVAEARLKGREGARTYALRELGVGSLDEGKALIERARTQQTEADQTVTQLRTQMTEQQNRHENLVDDLRQKVTAAEHQRDLARQGAVRMLRLTSVQIAAARMGFRRPEDDPARFLNLDDLAVNVETSTVGGVEEALQKLAEERPYLLEERKAETPTAPEVATAPDAAPEPPAPEPAPAVAPEPVVSPPPPLPPTPPATNGVTAEADVERELARRELAQTVKSWF